MMKLTDKGLIYGRRFGLSGGFTFYADSLGLEDSRWIRVGRYKGYMGLLLILFTK